MRILLNCHNLTNHKQFEHHHIIVIIENENENMQN